MGPWSGVVRIHRIRAEVQRSQPKDVFPVMLVLQLGETEIYTRWLDSLPLVWEADFIFDVPDRYGYTMLQIKLLSDHQSHSKLLAHASIDLSHVSELQDVGQHTRKTMELSDTGGLLVVDMNSISQEDRKALDVPEDGGYGEVYYRKSTAEGAPPFLGIAQSTLKESMGSREVSLATHNVEGDDVEIVGVETQPHPHMPPRPPHETNTTPAATKARPQLPFQPPPPSSSTQDRVKLLGDLASLKVEQEFLRTRLQDTEERERKAQDALQHQRATEKTVRIQMSELRRELSTKSVEVESLQSQLTRASSVAEAARDMQRSEAGDESEAVKELAKRSAEVTSLTSTTREQQRVIEDLTSDMEKLRKDNTSLHERINELEEESRQSTIKQHELESDLKTKVAQRAEIESIARENVTKLAHEISSLKRKLGDASTEIQSLRRVVEEGREREQALTQRLEVCETELKRWGDMAEDANGVVEKTSQRHAEVEKNCQLLRYQNAVLTKKLQEATSGKGFSPFFMEAEDEREKRILAEKRVTELQTSIQRTVARNSVKSPPVNYDQVAKKAVLPSPATHSPAASSTVWHKYENDVSEFNKKLETARRRIASIQTPSKFSVPSGGEEKSFVEISRYVPHAALNSAPQQQDKDDSLHIPTYVVPVSHQRTVTEGTYHPKNEPVKVTNTQHQPTEDAHSHVPHATIPHKQEAEPPRHSPPSVTKNAMAETAVVASPSRFGVETSPLSGVTEHAHAHEAASPFAAVSNKIDSVLSSVRAMSMDQSRGFGSPVVVLDSSTTSTTSATLPSHSVYRHDDDKANSPSSSVPSSPKYTASASHSPAAPRAHTPTRTTTRTPLSNQSPSQVTAPSAPSGSLSAGSGREGPTTSQVIHSYLEDLSH